MMVALLIPAAAPRPTRAAAPVSSSATPVLAYYYMWFNQASWASRKNDLPSLGAYDSTDPAVIAQHVAWARSAGIDAFIASWKNTPGLDKALAELVNECQKQGLKLVLIYEGLDVNRKPIPVATVAADLAWFETNYGSNPVFDLYGKPAVIWSGSWSFTNDEIAGVRSQLGAPGRLLLLGSEKDAPSYQARASLFDGDAYYWSSADPLGTPGYQRHLNDLAAAVHADGGLWLAPATAGFDGPLNGGTLVVDRRNGSTLSQAWADAVATKPDGIAVISWNEFTEASYIEPSRSYGLRYLQVLAGLTGASGPSATSGTASPTPTTTPEPSATRRPAATPGAALTGASVGRSTPPYEGVAELVVAALLLGSLVVLGIYVRRRGAALDPEAHARSRGSTDG
jgi:hypothetical protein